MFGKKFRFWKKKFGSDTNTKIGSWFRFPIPKPGFGRTLPERKNQVTSSHRCYSVTMEWNPFCLFLQQLLTIFFLWYVVLVPVMVLAKSIGECIRILLQKILYPIECVLFCSTTLVLLSHRGTLDPNLFHISNISMNLVN